MDQSTLPPSEQDLDFVRLSIREAERAREHGNHPFGAVLVNADGVPIMAAENAVNTQNEAIAHAEIMLLRAATRKFPADFLKGCTVYTNAEPCPMCASAMIWSNIRRVIFGLGMVKLYETFGDVGDAPTIKLESRAIFEHAPWPIEVHGPLLEEEALQVQMGFWQPA